ncbi:MAG: hypothetical protein OEV39_00835, partial [Gammaproteobacteria bacterium]|nr:hypothetical protein [Gammaproteobacteria bacterium]
TLESAQPVAERVRQAFANTVIDGVEGQRVVATLSAGVAQFGPMADSAIALVQQASMALLQAKSGGRNRVELAA